MDSIQVLLTTMQLKNPVKLLTDMNIQTSFIIGNQDTKDDRVEMVYNGNTGIIVSRNERGVGNNRNITLKYATADICVLADDDMTFVDGYAKIVTEVFNKYKNADVLIFNLNKSGNLRRNNLKVKKLNYFNYMNYGAARVAFRRKAVSYKAVSFNTNFGGGTPHSAGEDSLFLHDCLQKGLRVYAITYTIATLNDGRESTWFKGYTEKYFFDKGVFLAIAHPKLAKIFALYLVIRHHEYMTEEKTKVDVYKEICSGISYIKRRAYVDQ